jgi:hypothetical protein
MQVQFFTFSAIALFGSFPVFCHPAAPQKTISAQDLGLELAAMIAKREAMLIDPSPTPGSNLSTPHVVFEEKQEMKRAAKEPKIKLCKYSNWEECMMKDPEHGECISGKDGLGDTGFKAYVVILYSD